MVRVEKSVEINRPLEQVFYVVGAKYPRNSPRWSPAIKEIRQTSEGPFGLGARLHEVREINGKPTPTDIEITEFVENQILAFKSTGDSVKSSGRFTFQPSGAGTKVTFALDVEIGGLGRLATPIISRILNNDVEGDMNRIKAIMETPAAGG